MELCFSAKVNDLFKVTTVIKEISHLESNPLDWSVEEVVKYLQKTDCAPLAPLLKDQEQQIRKLSSQTTEAECHILSTCSFETIRKLMGKLC
ncbi:scm-like with four MBT domains protein 1 isoform X2 [Stegodyphus dumicola]|uniref:scm-like with four MBT domains protein 1 isoform X2 n=1 Tax=Stegodyphus dumicola TaxID=202533 RepID=UPI0015AA5AAC|nr:scm-like with four MBT domains protein 1 isoform X2 [Stegodyphus dumicola]